MHVFQISLVGGGGGMFGTDADFSYTAVTFEIGDLLLIQCH